MLHLSLMGNASGTSETAAGGHEATADLPNAFAWRLWEQKYRWSDPEHGDELRPRDSWQRVANAVAQAEPAQPDFYRQLFFDELSALRLLPGGRILAGAGTGRAVTLLNCFVLGVIEDSIEGIFRAVQEAALTMQRGGGVGLDFSTLRPSQMIGRRAGTVASGPVPFMEIFDTTCRVLLSTSPRRGAMMATLRCDHPDIEEFITAKLRGDRLRHFNLSVQVSDAFLAAVERDEPWDLVFPAEALAGKSGQLVQRAWTGHPEPIPCRVCARTPARKLWTLLVESAQHSGEPGVLFTDRINRLNNLGYREQITSTNPCGEVPLPPYGACDLASLNLVQFVREPFRVGARFDFEAMDRSVELAVRFLDDVLEVTPFPLEQEAAMAKGTRRIGLGVTGLADALILLGRRYDLPEGRELAAAIVRRLRDAAYRASIGLAQEKGPFPFFEPAPYLNGAWVRTLPPQLRSAIAVHGIRNGQLLALAPTGSISLLAGNVSSGVEPLFALAYRRRRVERDGTITEHPLSPYALRLWRELEGLEAALPPTFVESQSMSPHAQLEMLAALQPFIDGAISKTINLPAGQPADVVARLFELADQRGLKGCTVFPSSAPMGSVLEREGAEHGEH
ncbi:MAG: ribonucleoside-diphosphate reductase [Myxococcaceae bacterium]|nr:ribonucleoside-diphosphate reductase [Myxococcaceae bacterium]